MSRGVSRTVRETSWCVQHNTGGLHTADLEKDKEKEGSESGPQSPARESQQTVNEHHSPYTSPSRYSKGGAASPSKDENSSLILKSPFGYVGFRADLLKIQCNRIRNEVLTMVPASHGCVLLRASNGKYLRVDDNADLWADGGEGEGEEFAVNMKHNDTLSVQSGGGRYLRSQYSGSVTADALDEDESTIFTYSHSP